MLVCVGLLGMSKSRARKGWGCVELKSGSLRSPERQRTVCWDEEQVRIAVPSQKSLCQPC